MTFGEKLQRLRQKAGLSQDALAERLDVSRQAVSRWERNETMPETDKIVLMAEMFGVTKDYLLRDMPEKAEAAAAALCGTEAEIRLPAGRDNGEPFAAIKWLYGAAPSRWPNHPEGWFGPGFD